MPSRVLLTVALFCILALGCGTDHATGPDEGLAAMAAKGTAFKTHKVDVCHRTGEGYVRIRIAQRALRAHLAHGDEIPGGDVLDGDCEPAANGVVTVSLPGGATMDFVWIGPGTFTMGDVRVGHSPHEVTITRGFWLGRYQVTQQQWETVMQTTPWSGQNYVQPGAENAASYISWIDAQDLVAQLNAHEGATVYRLPTEAEWEFACRAGTSTLWHFGDDEAELGDYAWYKSNARDVGDDYPHAVGTRLPDPRGLFDMYGNLWEWCQDWYGQYSSEAQIDPQGPSVGIERVSRGGSFGDVAGSTRSAARNAGTPSRRYHYFGVRLLRTH